MRRNLPIQLLIAAVIMAYAQPSYAFKRAYHFYMTYTVAHWCGLDDYPVGTTTEAYAIAWGDYSTDVFHQTDAGSNPLEWLDPNKRETRRVFHFAVPRGKYTEKVVRNSSDAWETAEAAIAAASDEQQELYFFGLGLHTLQDSWSHEGYNPEIGHWTIGPDLPDTDVSKSIEAAGATWDAIDRWKQKTHGTGCTTKFEDVASLLQTWCSQNIHDDDALNAFWEKNAEAVGGHTVGMHTFDANATWSKDFLAAAAAVTKLKK